MLESKLVAGLRLTDCIKTWISIPKFKELINSVTDEDLAEENSENSAKNSEQESLETETENPGEEKENLPDY